jgi:hypothetical protein
MRLKCSDKSFYPLHSHAFFFPKIYKLHKPPWSGPKHRNNSIQFSVYQNPTLTPVYKCWNRYQFVELWLTFGPKIIFRYSVKPSSLVFILLTVTAYIEFKRFKINLITVIMFHMWLLYSLPKNLDVHLMTFHTRSNGKVIRMNRRLVHEIFSKPPLHITQPW